MARLEVGDIRIEGSDVRIGGVTPGAATAPANAGDAGIAAGLRVLDRIPFSGRFLILAGLAMAAAGTVINLALRAWTDPVGALTSGGVLAPLGVGVLVLGVLREYLRARPDVRHRAALGDAPDAHLDRLRELLREPGPHQTIPWITRATGWDEGAVLHALALLRSSGELLEEIDFDSGEFYYMAQPTPLTASPANLDTRLGTFTPQGARRT